MFLGFDSQTWQTIAAVIAVILFVGGIVAFIIRSIFKLGRFSQRLEGVEKTATDIRDEIKDTRTALTKRIDDLINITVQNGLSEAHSPRQLTQLGREVLRNSGMDTVVDDKFDYIVRKVREQEPENAYQAEQRILDAVEQLVDDPTVKDAVENGAFQSGHPVAAVLYVGGLYVRDKVLAELGFTLEEIDKHTPKSKNSK